MPSDRLSLHGQVQVVLSSPGVKIREISIDCGVCEHLDRDGAVFAAAGVRRALCQPGMCGGSGGGVQARIELRPLRQPAPLPPPLCWRLVQP